jgi:hypothetical protein
MRSGDKLEKLTVSVLENAFESEDTPMGHIAVSGEAGSGKTELIKQMVGSFLKSGKKILWFSTSNEENELLEKWKGHEINSEGELDFAFHNSYSFIVVRTSDVDFDKLKNYLIAESKDWVIVHDNLDGVALNYDQNEFETRKLDFLYFVSEFGRVYNLYTLIGGREIAELGRVLPLKKVLENSRNKIFLRQSYRSLKHAKKQGWLSDVQGETVKNLSDFEAFHVLNVY